MIKSFRIATKDSYDMLTDDFVNKLGIDCMKKEYGEYLYAFLNDDDYGTNSKYVRLKILNDSERHGMAFLIDGVDEILTFEVFNTPDNVEYPTGYCVSLEDAEIVKSIRTKQAIDDYCRYVGYKDLNDYITVFKNYKEKYPEKLI